MRNPSPAVSWKVTRSIELLLGPIIGGVGTLFGPILGAFVLTPLSESMTVLAEHVQLGSKAVDGIKQVFYGLIVIVIVLFQRRGLWPWLARRMKL